jgi:glycosyltransferase involved in cell wall biosynthesis
MVPYKRMDLIVEAFSRMPNRRLIVVGEGPDFDRLRAKAGPNVTLIGHQSAERLTQYLQMARAFIFAAEEDFGIAPVEAQACGTPVIAFGRGGATESIVDGQTGVLFREQTVESLVDAVKRFEAIGTWDAQRIRRRAECFAPEHFRTKFAKLVDREWAAFRAAISDGIEPLAEPTFAVPLPAIDPRTLDLDGPVAAVEDDEVLTAGDE